MSDKPKHHVEFSDHEQDLFEACGLVIVKSADLTLGELDVMVQTIKENLVVKDNVYVDPPFIIRLLKILRIAHHDEDFGAISDHWFYFTGLAKCKECEWSACVTSCSRVVELMNSNQGPCTACAMYHDGCKRGDTGSPCTFRSWSEKTVTRGTSDRPYSSWDLIGRREVDVFGVPIIRETSDRPKKTWDAIQKGD